MTPDQINQTALEIAEEALVNAADKGRFGWPTLDWSEALNRDDEEAIGARLREIAEEVATHG